MIILVVLVTCIYSVVSFHLFQSALHHSLFEESQERLNKSSEQMVSSLKQSFQEYNARLETIAILCAGSENGDRNQEITKTIQQLSAIQENVWYEIFDMDENVYTFQGRIRQIMDQDLFQAISNKEHYISSINSYNTFQKPAIKLAVPILRDEEVVGGVIGTFYVDYFTNILTKSVYDSIGATMIMQADGVMISSYEGMEQYQDFYSMLEQFSFPNKNYDLEMFKNNVKNGNNGFLLYEKNGVQRYASYQKAGIQDWYVIQLVMAESLSPRFNEITMQSVLFALSNTGMIMVLLIILFIYWRKVKHQTLEQQNIERFQMITRMQDKAVVFEYDLRYKTVHFSDNFKNTFGWYAPKILNNDVLKQYILNYQVLSDFEKIMKTEEQIELDLLIAKPNGTSVWYRLQAEILYDNKKQPEQVIGFLMNIDGDKKVQNQLLQRVELDDLTGLYNRDALKEQFIKFTKQKENNVALLFIDIDNFKQVNDTYGHLCGDQVLKKIAQLLKKETGHRGVAARYGGDEFLILLSDFPCSELKKFADTIIKQCQMEEVYNCSLSIGIACYPKDASSYKELIACADRALYKAKSSGKNQVQLFNE